MFLSAHFYQDLDMAPGSRFLFDLAIDVIWFIFGPDTAAL